MKMDDLEFTMALKWEYREEDFCFAAEGLVYCNRPVAPMLQCLNIYIPSAFMESDGTPRPGAMVSTSSGAVYNAVTVPIVFYNDIGGYAECKPAGLTERNRRFLENGYVLVSVGARGRQTRDCEGRACGKAPAALVDLKAAVRWLRFHAGELPAGDVERIVGVGTSAGGAMSSLLGVTGNAAEYLPMLEEIGAHMDERDDIFAAQCYCPIIDLEHADMAYEWMFRAKRIYTLSPRRPPRILTAYQSRLSQRLVQAYPAYINELGLGLQLDKGGRGGSYYLELMDFLSASLEAFLGDAAKEGCAREGLLKELDPSGSFITVDRTGHARIEDLDAYVLNFIGRMKGCPAFDPTDAASPENQEFGDPGSLVVDDFDKRHYSLPTLSAIADLEGSEADEVAYRYRRDIDERRVEMTGLINPMAFATGDRVSDIAPHVRIRVGSCDADHSFSASFNLYRALKMRGNDVDYGIVWGRGHCDADRSGEFGAWVDRICQ